VEYALFHKIKFQTLNNIKKFIQMIGKNKPTEKQEIKEVEVINFLQLITIVIALVASLIF
jgi:hypothetical protein